MDPVAIPGLASVVVPTYNRARFLPEALNSVARQTYRPIELLVVDDGSTDNTDDVVSAWSEKHRESDFRVRFLHQENAGAPAARNLGLIESRGEYIQYLDSDDLLHPQKLEIHVGAMESSPGCDFAWSGHNEFDHQSETVDFQKYDAHILHSEIDEPVKTAIFEATGNVWSGLYRRNLCVQAGPWDESLPRWQDLEYNARCAVQHPAARYVDAELYAMRIHSDGRIQDMEGAVSGIDGGLRSLRGIERAIAVSSHKENAARRALATLYLRLAKTALQHRRTRSARAALDGAERNAPSAGFQWKLAILQFTLSSIGPKASHFFLETYSSFRT